MFSKADHGVILRILGQEKSLKRENNVYGSLRGI